MTSVHPEPVTIELAETVRVSGLLQVPESPTAGCVVAHGAGAGMQHSFLTAMAEGLVDRGVAVLRYQFPYMEQRSRRPDSPKTAQATVRAAAIKASRLLPGIPLFAGGKSFGGRMTSQAQAESPLPGVHGLFFLGFPLHPAGKPSNQRGKHLCEVQVPMLFLQGTRDNLAELGLMQSVVQRLGERATLKLLPEADHMFHVPARTGRKDADVRAEMLDEMVTWTTRVTGDRLRSTPGTGESPTL